MRICNLILGLKGLTVFMFPADDEIGQLSRDVKTRTAMTVLYSVSRQPLQHPEGESGVYPYIKDCSLLVTQGITLGVVTDC